MKVISILIYYNFLENHQKQLKFYYFLNLDFQDPHNLIKNLKGFLKFSYFQMMQP